MHNVSCYTVRRDTKHYAAWRSHCKHQQQLIQLINYITHRRINCSAKISHLTAVLSLSVYRAFVFILFHLVLSSPSFSCCTSSRLSIFLSSHLCSRCPVSLSSSMSLQYPLYSAVSACQCCHHVLSKQVPFHVLLHSYSINVVQSACMYTVKSTQLLSYSVLWNYSKQLGRTTAASHNAL